MRDDGAALISALVDQAIAVDMVPWSCPCEFGPGGRYRLEELIGAGGGGLVYRATDQLLSSEGFAARVAVKILGGHLPRNEALTARRIDHPSVMTVIDRGTTEDGAAYIVSEYIDGGDLSDVAVPMRPREAASLVAKLAGAVQAAHSAGVVHCDLKPSNVLMTREGEPKLSDFGLARWDTDMETGVRGNAAFMPPEQYAGSPDSLTPPADVYALGGLLYYLLTGVLPHGESPRDVAEFHAARRRIARPGIDGDLDRICLRATDPDRSLRYSSAAQVQEDLMRWLRREPLDWTRPTAVHRLSLFVRRRPVLSVLTPALFVLAGIGVGTWRYNVEMDRLRQIESTARAAEMAHAEVEDTKLRVRRQIEAWATQVFVRGNPDTTLLAVLPWIEWLGGAPVLLKDGGLPAAGEREAMLLAHIAATSAAGENRLDTLLSKYALALLLLGMDRPAEAEPLIDELKQKLAPRLSPDDPLPAALETMAVCAVYLKASPAERPALDAALEREDTRHAGLTGTSGIRDLIVLVRSHRAPAKVKQKGK